MHLLFRMIWNMELLKFVEQSVMRKVQENKEWLELNAAHQLLVYADSATLLGENEEKYWSSIRCQ